MTIRPLVITTITHCLSKHNLIPYCDRSCIQAKKLACCNCLISSSVCTRSATNSRGVSAVPVFRVVNVTARCTAPNFYCPSISACSSAGTCMASPSAVVPGKQSCDIFQSIQPFFEDCPSQGIYCCFNAARNVLVTSEVQNMNILLTSHLAAFRV